MFLLTDTAIAVSLAKAKETDMSADRALTPHQARALRWLHRSGGSGVIDRYGRVVAGGEPVMGDGRTWLFLLALGLVSGADGRVALTDLGRRKALSLGGAPAPVDDAQPRSDG